MAKAIWKDKVIAESDDFKVVEGNLYFPPESIHNEFLKESDRTSVCPWKGLAHYYTVEIEGQDNADAAWYYPEPSAAAQEIKDYVAFWKGVQVEK